MENMIIGTAGHVDHGKSTLIKALTGIETDTTTEEKVRGMSINLGFAYFDLDENQRVGIVDVPGHEKFIKNMMAGLAGLNLVLLVIDVNEGIMPQTLEHIDILQLLGIQDYIIVLSKIGTAEADLIELVEEDIVAEFANTKLQKAPIMKVDAITKEGLAALKLKIKEMSQIVAPKNTLSPPRMHVDRSFLVKGFGTVVTGTLIEGQINVGDSLVVYPLGKTTKIRGLQVHNHQANTAVAGQRVAINLANLAIGEIARGATLAPAKAMTPSFMLDVKVDVLANEGAMIKLWDRLRLHIGTKEVLCRAVPLGADAILAGQSGYLQLRLEELVVALSGDKCIIRQYSPMKTIAGATILDANPTKHKRFNEALLAGLTMKESDKPEDQISDFLFNTAKTFTTLADVGAYLGQTNEKVSAALNSLLQAQQVIMISNLYMHMAIYELYQQEAIGYLRQYHQKYPLRIGMPKEELRSKFPKIAKGKEFDLLLEAFVAAGLVKGADLIWCADFVISYTEAQLKAQVEILKTLQTSGFTPVGIVSITNGASDLRELIESMNGQKLYRLDSETIIGANYYQELVAKVRAFLTEHQSITLADFRDMIDSSRKYSMIILEYMDKEKVTRRVQNTRVLY